MNNTKNSFTKIANNIFGKSNIKSIHESPARFIRRYKAVVFVPEEMAEVVIHAMASAGAGVIGNYTVCSFRLKGKGTFTGGKASNPVVGKKGKFETLEEVRIEMLCDEASLPGVIDAMLEVHPYEEPAHEIYPVLVMAKDIHEAVVNLKKAVTLSSVLGKINSQIDAGNLSNAAETKVKQVIIRDSGAIEDKHASKSNNKVLYMNRNSKGIFNMRLL